MYTQHGTTAHVTNQYAFNHQISSYHLVGHWVETCRPYDYDWVCMAAARLLHQLAWTSNLECNRLLWLAAGAKEALQRRWQVDLLPRLARRTLTLQVEVVVHNLAHALQKKLSRRRAEDAIQVVGLMNSLDLMRYLNRRHTQ